LESWALGALCGGAFWRSNIGPVGSPSGTQATNSKTDNRLMSRIVPARRRVGADMKRFQFSIRDLLWLTLMVALGALIQGDEVGLTMRRGES